MSELILFLKRFLHCLGHVYGIIIFLNLFIVTLGILFGVIEEIGPFKGIYFSYVSALAIGYGDIVPHTILGRFISIVLGVIGIVLFGIIVGISTRTVILMMHPDDGHHQDK